MSYHIKDLIADIATIEKAELLIDSIDLLNTVNYSNHLEKLEDIVMTYDSFPTSETVALIESTLLSSLIDCCKDYGLYIDEDCDILTLNKVIEIANGLFDLMTDEGNNFDNSIGDDSDNKSKMIRFLIPLTYLYLDEDQLNELIEQVEDDLIMAIEENEQLLENDKKIKIKSLARLQASNILNDCTLAKDLILASGYGFDFYETLSLVKRELVNMTDLKQKSLNFIAILLASDVDNKDINSYFDETIDYLVESEQEAIKLRIIAVKILRDIQNV